ncbi:MAG: hypothetical protein J6Y85_04295 [Alphaproteobacteria bacterium]|nr:hypothetical protein [Alphaproteobacteria bacterium]
MLENTQTIESFMGSFGIVPMTTFKDEGLLSFENCKKRILDMIKLNIQNFKTNAWNENNRMLKMLVDLDEKKNKSIFTVRLGGKRVYRCNCDTLTTPQKIEFLTKFYEGTSRGLLDKNISDFCEQQVALAEDRKKIQREKRKAQRKAEREALKQKEADALAHQPQSAV